MLPLFLFLLATSNVADDGKNGENHHHANDTGHPQPSDGELLYHDRLAPVIKPEIAQPTTTIKTINISELKNMFQNIGT